MRPAPLSCIAALSLALVPPSLSAQQRVTLDLRAAVAAPITEFAEADLSTGFGFGGTLAYRVQPHLHLYAGWDWLRFTADDAFVGGNLDFEETGYTFGLRFEHPFGADARLRYRVEAGGLYKHVEVEDEDGTLVEDSGHGLGFEVGVGLLMPMGERWLFTPTARLRSHEPTFDVGGTDVAGTMRYIALELGFARRFR